MKSSILENQGCEKYYIWQQQVIELVNGQGAKSLPYPEPMTIFFFQSSLTYFK